MEFYSRRALVVISTIWGLLLGQAAAEALELDYCSTSNLGIGKGAYDTWMSNGWCEDYCSADYAVAIVQFQLCWCSNNLPSDTVDLSNCNDPCPGYDVEDCGSEEGGKYFGYRVLMMEPSATVGPGSPSLPTNDNDDSTTSKTTSKSTTSTPTSQSSVTSKVTSMNLVTQDGTVVTQTVVQTSVVAAPADNSQSTVQSSSTSAGTIAGAVVGGVGGLALIVAGVLFFFWRQRRRQHSEYAGSDGGGSSGVTRNTSVLSKTGLLGTAEKGYLPPIHTGGRRSANALDMESTSPTSDRRNSRPIFYDQRLNPSALMDNDNSSRASIGTVQDNRDYSRTLNIRNPDPEPDEMEEPDHNHAAVAR